MRSISSFSAGTERRTRLIRANYVYTYIMQYEWDDEKSRRNKRVHYAVAFTERGKDMLRVVSLRLATRNERKSYGEAKS